MSIWSDHPLRSLVRYSLTNLSDALVKLPKFTNRYPKSELFHLHNFSSIISGKDKEYKSINVIPQHRHGFDNTETQEIILKAVSKGLDPMIAAAKAKIPKARFIHWLKYAEADIYPFNEWYAEIEAARATVAEDCVHSYIHAKHPGKGAEFWLKHNYAQYRDEVPNQNTGNTTINQTNNYLALSPADKHKANQEFKNQLPDGGLQGYLNRPKQEIIDLPSQ